MKPHILAPLGTSLHEVGAGGTAYVELRNTTTNKPEYKSLKVDNNGNDYPHMATYSEGDLRNLFDGMFVDIERVGGVTYLYHNDTSYDFDLFDIRGNAHVAILSDTANEDISVFVNKMTGDRTGVLHIAQRQTFEFIHLDIYLPCNVMDYK